MTHLFDVQRQSTAVRRWMCNNIRKAYNILCLKMIIKKRMMLMMMMKLMLIMMIRM